MGKYILVAILLLLIVGCGEAVVGKGYADFEPEQKQFYWSCIKEDCTDFLKNKQYGEWRSCVYDCIAQAEEVEPTPQDELFCEDTDAGMDYKNFGTVTDNKGAKDDYCYESNGKNYVFEGVCKNDKYVRFQKNCKEFGQTWNCVEGACVNSVCEEVDNAIVGEYPGCEVSCNEGYELEDGVCVELICDTTEIDNGLISAYPDCEVSCNDGYDLIDGVCVSNNHAPILNPIGNFEINVGQELVIELFATDEDGDELSYYTATFPTGAEMNGNTFTWTPTEDQIGENEIMFVVSDGELDDSEVIVVEVSVEVAPEIAWDKTFGGENHDYGRSVRQTMDGNYIVAGTTSSYGEGYSDFWLIKTDTQGNKIWDKTYGGSNSEYGYSVQLTTDGGYILAGSTISYGNGKEDFWLVKTDSNGNKEWDEVFGGSETDKGRSALQTADGGYVMVGHTRSFGNGEEIWLIKTDSQGNKEWDKVFTGYKYDRGYSVEQTTDGGYIVVGYTASYGKGGRDMWLIKTDSQGNKEWDKTFGGKKNDVGYSVQLTIDGGYIVAGSTRSFGNGQIDGNDDFWLVKTDSQGNKEWDKTFGGSETKNPGNYGDRGEYAQEMSDGGYIISGTSNTMGNWAHSFWLVKTDSQGNKIWDVVIDGDNTDHWYSLQPTTDNGFIITTGMGDGLSDSNLRLIKLGGE